MTTPVANPELTQSNELIQPKIPTLSKTSESPSNGAVFAKGKSEVTRSLEGVSDPIRADLETLRGLQKMNPTKEREQQIFNLERKRKRSMSFAFIQTRGTEEQKKIIEKRSSLEELKASDALFLKKKGVDLANLFLVTDTNPTSSVSRDAIKEKDNFIVNFWENKNINAVIGAGDILPPTVSRVRINGVEGERKHFPRPGYYDAKGKYLPIFDGDKLEVVKIGEVDEKTLQEARDSDDIWLRERRIEDMIDTDGKAITDLAEDKKLEEDVQKEIKQRKEIRESIGTMRKGRFFGTTNKPVSETVKALKDLDAADTNTLLKKVFGEWPATNLLIEIDGGSTVAVKRMIALAYHEGGLVFGRQNPDPASGFNIGTFQIGWSNSTRESSLNKYEDCLQAWIKLAWQKSMTVDYERLKNDPAQRDLMTHLGYIQSQRGGAETFARLRDPSLMDNEVIDLMHHDIQWGIRAIGESVVAQVKNTKIDLEQIRTA